MIGDYSQRVKPVPRFVVRDLMDFAFGSPFVRMDNSSMVFACPKSETFSLIK
jgi:hypothetical protein